MDENPSVIERHSISSFLSPDDASFESKRYNVDLLLH